MTSEQLYVWHHTHFIYDILGTIHNVTSTVWVHKIVVTTLHPLYSWHHTHDNTKVISAISPSISDTTSTVSVSSNTVYQLCYTTLCMTLHTICMTSHSVCMTSHENFMTSHPYRYDITSSIYMTLYPIYMISLLLFHENKVTTWHLTHCIWHHNLCICVVTPALSMPSQQLWNSSHLAHVWHHTPPTSHQIQTLWHQSSVFRTSQTLHSWYQISYIWHHVHGLWHLIPYMWQHRHYIGKITPTMFVNTY